MRKQLGNELGERKKFKAKFERWGKKINYKGYSEETLLFTQVTDLENNRIVTDHLWFSITKGFEEAKPERGDWLEFEARVKRYKKGYVNKTYQINQQTSDYKLSHPTQIRKIK